MAMLAEPRRKQKWSVDPRNSTWSKDDSKFGQKMLEKMGWSKGKGLGAQEQGSTEHVKVQLKNNTLGLGASRSYEDNWIAHQDDFNQLLADLNNCHGAAGSDSPTENSNKSFSLEEKSKSSKKRVHYMKFAKGKDLSCRSGTDLACIFGKREKSKKSSQEEADVDSEESEGKEKESPSPTNEAEPGNTVTSTLSVNEYFAKRMAELKKSRSKNSEVIQQYTETNPLDGTDSSSEEPKKKRKKKKRNKKDSDCLDELVENAKEDDSVHKRKSKSKKRKEDNTEEQEEIQSQNNTEEQEETLGKGKKSKRKKSKRTEALDVIETKDDDSSPNEDILPEEPKRKKKKKQKSEY